jgi:1-acyl-sn-glycerol-3-phosphate acyltransferase
MTTTPPPSPATAPVKKTPPAGPIARALARVYLWFFGWKIEGSVPPSIRAVAIAYPHTTNWDLPFMLAIAYRLGIRPSWLGKRQLFRKPFGGFMRWLGGIPSTAARTNMVTQVVERFGEIDRLFLVIPLSGTRHRRRTGSRASNIARGAGADPLHVPRLQAQGRRHRAGRHAEW